MKTLAKSFTQVRSLYCAKCDKEYSLSSIKTYATCCNQPLVVRFDLNPGTTKEIIHSEDMTMWRYTQLLPVLNKKNIVSLGEGMTPILPLQKLSDKYGLAGVVMKDETYNPTGSFKARGISLAVSKAKEFNINRCIISTAGNAGGALAAYCAKASIECTVIMPDKTPDIFKQECRLYGAELILVNGLINECAKKAEVLKLEKQYFDISTMKEPYRIEGKKQWDMKLRNTSNGNYPM